MNQVDARSVLVFGGYHGEFRKVHKAGWEKVCENGIPRLFRTELEAENAAWRALRSHLMGDIVGTAPAEKASFACSAAEKLFDKVFPGKGRKPVPVERR